MDMSPLAIKLESNFLFLFNKIFFEKNNSHIKLEPKEIFANIKILIALSGGVDSVAMASACTQIRKKYPNFKIAAAYVNHQIQDLVQQRRELFVVQEITNRLNMNLYQSDTQDLPSYTDRKDEHVSEHEARDYRYAQLLKIAKTKNFKFILLAHHTQDNLETVMMRFLEGRGVQGLRGIPIYRKLEKSEIFIIRPCLINSVIHKHELLEEVNQNNFHIHQDPSNLGISYRRNILRNRILPEIKKHYPNIGNISLSEGIYKLSTDLRNILNTTKTRLREIQIFNGLDLKGNSFLRINRHLLSRLSSIEKFLLCYDLLNTIGINNISEDFLDEIIVTLDNTHNDKSLKKFLISHIEIVLDKNSVFITNIHPQLAVSNINSKKNLYQHIDYKIVDNIEESNHLIFDLQCFGIPQLRYASKHDCIYKNNTSINIRAHMVRHSVCTKWNEIPLIEDKKGIVAVVGDCVLAPTLLRSNMNTDNTEDTKYVMAVSYKSIKLQKKQ